MQHIPTSLQVLIERLQGKESLEVEFKSAQGGLPRSVWETVSAFANTRGGWIILGITQHAEQIAIEGVHDADKQVQVFMDTLHNPTKLSYRICGAEDVVSEHIGGRDIIIIRVPAAPRKVRPVYINQNPYMGTFVRRHTGDYHCTKPDVDRMMREASDVGVDSTVLANYDLSDIDADTLARYRRRYQTQRPESPWNSYPDQEFLKAVCGWRRDRERGIEGITVAGLLLFGKAEAIRDWRTRHLIDYRLLPDANPESRWDDRITWEGNLLGAFEAIYPRLIQGQPLPFRLEGVVRVDEGFAQAALREALVNLLVHADYSESLPSLILRSPEGYSLRNPGSSRVPDIDLLTGDRSDPRNPELVRMFRHIGLAEEAGTGIPKIMQSWRNLGFRMPEIDTGTERYEFMLELRHAHLIAEEDRRWLHSLGGIWSEGEQLALVHARHAGSIDNVTLRQITGQHAVDITRLLVGLRNRGLLQMSGIGRGARYQLNTDAVGEVNLEGSLWNSEDFDTDSEDSDSSFNLLWSELWDLSQVAREQHHLMANVLDNLVIKLCSKTSLSVKDLAKLLDRHPNYIIQVVKHLLSERKLSRLYPEQPNHPRQRYIASETLI